MVVNRRNRGGQSPQLQCESLEPEASATRSVAATQKACDVKVRVIVDEKLINESKCLDSKCLGLSG